MDADRVQLRLIEEDEFGDSPSASNSGTTIAADGAAEKFTDSGNGFGDFKVNQMIEVAGFTNAANNGNFKVTAVASDGSEISVDGDLTTEAAGNSITVKTALEEVRFTGEDLGQDTTTIRSTEINEDRQVENVKRVDIGVSGPINHELSALSFDKLFEAVLMSSGFSDEVEVTGTTYSCADADNSINDSGNNFVTDGFVANQLVKISGFTTTANNGFAKIVSVAAGKMVLKAIDFADEVAGDTVTITMLPQIVNGTSKRSFSVEREYTDAGSTLIALYNGVMFESWELTAAVEAMITGAFNTIGKAESSETSSLGTGTVIDAGDTEPMAAVDEIYNVWENYSVAEATNLSLTIANNLRSRKVLGALGAQSIGTGKVNVTGSIEKYFENSTIMDKYLNFTETALTFLFEDADGNALIIDIPSVRYSAGRRVAGGENTDIMAAMDFEAHKNATEDVTVRIAKYEA